VNDPTGTPLRPADTTQERIAMNSSNKNKAINPLYKKRWLVAGITALAALLCLIMLIVWETWSDVMALSADNAVKVSTMTVASRGTADGIPQLRRTRSSMN